MRKKTKGFCAKTLCKSIYYQFNPSTCRCQPVMLCRKMCPMGQGLHPSYKCKCVDQAELDVLEANRKGRPTGPEQMLVPARECPMVKCGAPKSDCQIISSTETNGDGCPTYPCGIKVCDGDNKNVEFCNEINYEFNEKPTGNRCKTDCQCDGLRKCGETGWCEGTIRKSTRPPVGCPVARCMAPQLGCRRIWSSETLDNGCPRFLCGKIICDRFEPEPKPVICPMVKCAAKLGCKFVQDGKTDANGCLVKACGNLVCEKPKVETKWFKVGPIMGNRYASGRCNGWIKKNKPSQGWNWNGHWNSKNGTSYCSYNKVSTTTIKPCPSFAPCPVAKPGCKIVESEVSGNCRPCGTLICKKPSVTVSKIWFNVGPIWSHKKASSKCNSWINKNKPGLGWKWNGHWYSKKGTSYCQYVSTINIIKPCSTFCPKAKPGCKIVESPISEISSCRPCGKLVCEQKTLDCKSENFTFNEGPRGNKCKSACHCDGARTCSWAGWCQGTSRTVRQEEPEPVQETEEEDLIEDVEDEVVFKKFESENSFSDWFKDFFSWGKEEETKSP